MKRDILEYFRNNTSGKDKREDIIFEHFSLLEYAVSFNEKENLSLVAIYPGMGDKLPSMKYYIGSIIDGSLYYSNKIDAEYKFPLRDELTEAMHSEFTVDEETDTKHRVWALLTLCGTGNPSGWNKWMKGYNVTIEDINKHLQEFKDLSNE